MKKQINLYQPSCYPKREKATFKQFLILFGLCIFSVLVLALTLDKQFSDIEEAIGQQKASLIKKQSELNGLASELQHKSAPESKQKQQLALQSEIAVKQRLLAGLKGIEWGTTVSFSDLMRGLSLANMSSISIESFSLIDGRLNVSGQAKESDSVPLWLAKIQTTKELSGISFEKLAISESETSKGFFFQLGNKLKAEKLKVRGND